VSGTAAAGVTTLTVKSYTKGSRDASSSSSVGITGRSGERRGRRGTKRRGRREGGRKGRKRRRRRTRRRTRRRGAQGG